MRIVCIGDSLTKGSYLQKPLPNRLAEAYPGMDVINLGVAGEVTSQILARVATVATYLPVRTYVWGGINDVGSGFSAATIESNLQGIYTACAAYGEVVAITITQDDNHTAPMIVVRNTVNSWMSSGATGVTRVVNACTITEDPLNIGDRLPAYADASAQNHLNDAGIAAIVSAIIA
jgi:lysophospholipase L1-like esterase